MVLLLIVSSVKFHSFVPSSSLYHPMNTFPTRVGDAEGAVTVRPCRTVSVFAVESSANFPPFALNVTVCSFKIL